ncbi:hypothetical protein BvCmsKKNP011_00053 [Escherichia coli]|nr:hypothetical protein BvCmsKKNP011_00053 [Escherichia coli]
MLGNLINGFRPLLRFRQTKRRQRVVSRLAHTALEAHLCRSRQLVSIRARIPFLKECGKVRLSDPGCTQHQRVRSVTVGFSTVISFAKLGFANIIAACFTVHQLEQVPAFHPFTLAVELRQFTFWIPFLDIKVLLSPLLQLRVHQQTITRTATRPCLTVALLQIFRRNGNIVSDTVHLAEITILHVQRQHVVRNFSSTRYSQRRFCGVMTDFMPDQPVVQRRRRQRGAVRREAAVHHRVTRVRITDGDLHIVSETMFMSRQCFIGKHPVLTVFAITAIEVIHRAGKGIQFLSELFQTALVIAGLKVLLRRGVDERV